MRIKTFIVVLFCAFNFTINAQESFEVDFTTLNYTANRQPAHVLAVWIKTSAGSYINSLAVYATSEISYLKNWNSSSRRIKGDASTGATIPNHSIKNPHKYFWNFNDYLGNSIHSGNYILCLEMNSDDKKAPKYFEIPFSLDNGSFENSLGTHETFSNISIKYITNSNTAIQNKNSFEGVKIYPQPANSEFHISITGTKNASYNIEIIDITGKRITSLKEVKYENDDIILNAKSLGLIPGKYILCISEKNFRIVKTLIIS